ncbi:hydratase [Methylobacterium sp. WL103]|uniref:2-keto-4-pentenoate hydratase n=1 Tax=Methylobacterium sp. WL103 TaxID=2603891 RepID=UPI0011C71E00|nr:hydratase [Methylobacterium sp. WL103]TXN06628.1 hydratase [Methylobacterium sp. WL103]
MSFDPTQNADAFVNHAETILTGADQRRHIQLLTECNGSFGLTDAYRVTAKVRRLRELRGQRVIGRKIGFTNTTIWAEYNINAPIWGYVYDTTRHSLAHISGPVTLAPFVEPRIEPEIVFGLARAPEAGMDERALIACVGWVALGFEVVQSLFPDWRFRAPDTVAAFGLHGALYVGEPAPVTPETEAGWLGALCRFDVQLHRDGEIIETGRASNVLQGGPLAALRHLVEVLADDPSSPPLAAGEVITTGTLTNAYPINAGETWSTALSGLPLVDIRLAF